MIIIAPGHGDGSYGERQDQKILQVHAENVFFQKTSSPTYEKYADKEVSKSRN
jgi:hypothetical protein